MKIKLMLPVAAALSTIIIIACDKMHLDGSMKKSIYSMKEANATNVMPLPGPTLLNKGVGKLFPADTGASWVSNFNRLNPSYNYASACIFNSDDLETILKSGDCIGISFSHIWINNEWGLLAYGVDASSTIIKNDSVLSNNGYISNAQAERLKQAYSLNNLPGAIKSEFFGSDLLNQLLNVQGIKSLLIRKGINTKGECMILSNATNPTDPVGDDAFPCPKICPLN